MRLLKTPSYPLAIWVTDDCNKRCKYCFYGISEIFQQGFKPKYMTKQTANATIKFINSGSVETLTFFGGEPLLNWSMMRYILARTHLPYITASAGLTRAVYNVTTNGTLLTPEILSDLELFDVFVNLSLDGTPETHNKWRDASYDEATKHLDLLLKYPRLQVLKTLASPDTLFEDVKHIKELGFKKLYINLLNGYSTFTYENYDAKDFKHQYKRVLNELVDKNFQLSDYTSWRGIIKPDRPKAIGCGFINRGLGMGPDGKFYPCHEGPSLKDNEKFVIGSVFKGIDHEREAKIRKVSNAPLCEKCYYKLTKCYVSMYNKHGRFGVDPPKWHMNFERAKIEVIEELNNYESHTPPCADLSSSLLLATLISGEKHYLLKPFLSSIETLDLPLPTDYYIVVNDDEIRLQQTLRMWKRGEISWLPDLRDKFRKINILSMPTIKGESFMWRIARGRNMILGIARKDPRYAAYAFVDSDIILPSDALSKLFAVDDGIVGALVKCRRRGHKEWYNNYCLKPGGGIATINEFEEGSILHVDATGSDCILVRRPVFMNQIYEYKPEIPEAEDMGFCFKARENGFNVRVHTGVVTRHIDLVDVKI